MFINVLLAAFVASVVAHDDDKGFFALNSPAFQPMARQWMPSISSMGFEDDEMRFHNFARAGGNSDFFFGGFDDIRDDFRFGFDDDRLRAVANYRSSFRNPVFPQGQPVARRISVPYRGYYGDDDDDDMDDYYTMNRFYSPPMGGFGFRPSPFQTSFNLQMGTMMGPQIPFGGPQMGMMSPGLPSPFMMSPFMMRGPMMGPMPMMMGPMIGGPMNPIAFAQQMQMQHMMKKHWYQKMKMMMRSNAMMKPMMGPMMPYMQPMMKPMMPMMGKPQMMPMMGKPPMMQMKKKKY